MLNPSDKEIVDKACNGDVKAFRLLVERHQRFVYRVAFRFLGSVADAEDITQECFIRLWKNLHRYRANVKMTTWLYKIATNLCLDFLKSGNNRTTKSTVLLDDYKEMRQVLPADQPLIDSELQTVLARLIFELSPKQRAVFVLRDIEQVETFEIAEILSMDAGQVKSNLYYARKRMSEMLISYYQIRNVKS